MHLMPYLSWKLAIQAAETWLCSACRARSARGKRAFPWVALSGKDRLSFQPMTDGFEIVALALEPLVLVAFVLIALTMAGSFCYRERGHQRRVGHSMFLAPSDRPHGESLPQEKPTKHCIGWSLFMLGLMLIALLPMAYAS